MADRNAQWNKIFNEAQQNNEILNNANVVKGLSLIIHLNERVSFSTKTPYWSYGCTIFDNLIKSFVYYSDCINQQFNNKQSIDVNTRQYIIYNKTVIKFLTSLVNNTDDVQIIQNEILHLKWNYDIISFVMRAVLCPDKLRRIVRFASRVMNVYEGRRHTS